MLNLFLCSEHPATPQCYPPTRTSQSPQICQVSYFKTKGHNKMWEDLILTMTWLNVKICNNFNILIKPYKGKIPKFSSKPWTKTSPIIFNKEITILYLWWRKRKRCAENVKRLRLSTHASYAAPATTRTALSECVSAVSMLASAHIILKVCVASATSVVTAKLANAILRNISKLRLRTKFQILMSEKLTKRADWNGLLVKVIVRIRWPNVVKVK